MRRRKNEHFRKIVKQAVGNEIQFKYVLADSWYGNQANMRFIRGIAKKDFVLALKSNTTVCTKIGRYHQSHFQRREGQAHILYLGTSDQV